MKACILALLVANLTLIVSCNRCTNEVPYFSHEEIQWLSQYNLADTVWFEKTNNHRTAFIITRKDTSIYLPVNGKSLREPCPDLQEFTGVFEMMGKFEIPGSVYSPTFIVTIKKDRINSSRHIYWGEFTGEPVFKDPQFIKQMQINGSTYNDVFMEECDTNISYSPGRNPSYRIYYNAANGLLKFENTLNEIWERMPQ
jgi:hypothetical protein